MAMAMVAALAVLPCLAGQDAEMKVARRPLRMGETAVDVVISERAGSRHLFCNLHDDENTSARGGAGGPETVGGQAGRAPPHRPAQHLPSRLQAKSYRVDPNRIFTLAGVPRDPGDAVAVRRGTPRAASAGSPRNCWPSTASTGPMQ